jgi:hypothetical protein
MWLQTVLAAAGQSFGTQIDLDSNGRLRLRSIS